MSLCPKSPLKADIHEHDKFDAHDLESLVVATEEKVGRSKTEVCFKGIPRAELHRPYKILNGFLVLSDHRVRPHDFVLQRRIERAQELRRDPELALVDVALSVGFQTQAHFTTVFKRFAGEELRIVGAAWRQDTMLRNTPSRLTQAWNRMEEGKGKESVRPPQQCAHSMKARVSG